MRWESNVYETGYFGHEGSMWANKVHIRRGKWCICGTIAPYAEWQWCAKGVYLPYVTCLRCLATLEKMKSEEVEKGQ